MLDHLRIDARLKLTSLSKLTKVPVSTLFGWLNEFNDTIIKKRTVLVNFGFFGYATKAHVFVAVTRDEKDLLQQFLYCERSVNNLYRINNGWDFIVETVHKDIRELDGFLEKMSSQFKILKQEIHYLIDDVKREGFRFVE